jgi:hypothetical protein
MCCLRADRNRGRVYDRQVTWRGETLSGGFKALIVDLQGRNSYAVAMLSASMNARVASIKEPKLVHASLPNGREFESSTLARHACRAEQRSTVRARV